MSDSDAARPLAILWRHYRERLSKCSLQPLVGDSRFQFEPWRPDSRIDASGTILLEIDAPELTAADAGRPLLLLDATWRYLPKMRDSVFGDDFVTRSLPASVTTAYPRVAKLSHNPEPGLASIEALYAALRLVGIRDDSLLDGYHWRDDFLKIIANS